MPLLSTFIACSGNLDAQRRNEQSSRRDLTFALYVRRTGAKGHRIRPFPRPAAWREVTAMFTDILRLHHHQRGPFAGRSGRDALGVFRSVQRVVAAPRRNHHPFHGDSSSPCGTRASPIPACRACCRCALAGRGEAQAFNSAATRQGIAGVSAPRFGIHTRTPVVGRSAARERLQYTAMGRHGERRLPARGHGTRITARAFLQAARWSPNARTW